LPVSSVIRTLGKIIIIVATRCQILRLKCTKYNFGWGSAPDPAGGAYSAPPDRLAALRGPTSKGRRGDETPPLHAPLSHISGYAPGVKFGGPGFSSTSPEERMHKKGLRERRLREREEMRENRVDVRYRCLGEAVFQISVLSSSCWHTPISICCNDSRHCHAKDMVI